ncbi:MAG TPA: imidazole glycerol phosphate synthase subunit HisF [Synergistaceae bacterium]|nr:MAG: Imidazole glycerol phosphate synthase subunit HisF [Synergistales bacterium 57_84]KUK88466.1 MAG: Imidazole glycerol phosphate synthase subunit HisF [Synergistales bacterium 58_81]HBG14059.1 imidazole glycerol phosphate synthase subunit HisF [Synergistaceae bacterium]
MLTRRIIPCLDVKDGRVVKGIRFRELRDAGDPATMAAEYMSEGADELVFLDIGASLGSRSTMLEWVSSVADMLFIPFTVGGGIVDESQARRIISLGADKVSLNTAAVRDPDLIRRCSSLLGSQAVVLAVDALRTGRGHWEVMVRAGTEPAGIDLLSWVRKACSLGCGEILLTSIDSDGTLEGYDTECIEAVAASVPVPVIASGGAGRNEHFLEAFRSGADAALAASVFHFGTVRICELKAELSSRGIPMRIEAGGAMNGL